MDRGVWSSPILLGTQNQLGVSVPTVKATYESLLKLERDGISPEFGTDIPVAISGSSVSNGVTRALS